MAADKDLKPGSTVMTIPLKEVLYHGTVDKRIRAACDALPCNMSRAMLALGVAYERNLGKDSKFAAFISTLPAAVTNYVGWPLPMLNLMEVAIPGTKGYLSLELREMRGANELLKDPVSENDIAWGIAMVQTRAFGAAWDGKEALIPGATFLNHHWDQDKAIPMPKCDIQGGKCFVQTGSKRIAKGEQLYFHYRPWSNLQLIIRYGFEVPGNPWGPEVRVVPLGHAPEWLRKAGCETKPLRLRDTTDPEGAPFPEHDIRCARAATLANESDAQSLEAEKLWQAGAFNESSPTYDMAAGGYSGFVELSKSCKGAAAKWTNEEAIAILTEVAGLKYSTGNTLIGAIQHDLTLLMRCEELFKQLAKEAGASEEIFAKIDADAAVAEAARREQRLKEKAEKEAEDAADAAADAAGGAADA